MIQWLVAFHRVRVRVYKIQRLRRHFLERNTCDRRKYHTQLANLSFDQKNIFGRSHG